MLNQENKVVENSSELSTKNSVQVFELGECQLTDPDISGYPLYCGVKSRLLKLSVLTTYYL